MNENTTEDIVSQAQMGDQGALEVIFARFEGLVQKSISSYCNYPWLRDELLQEGQYHLYCLIRDFDRKKTPRFDGYAKKNLEFYYRSRARTIRRHLNRQDDLSIDAMEYESEIFAIEEDPDLDLIRQETRELVRAAMDQLTEEERTTLYLFYMEDMTMEDIATQLGVCVRTVYNRKHSALLKLRRYCNPYGDDDDTLMV